MPDPAFQVSPDTEIVLLLCARFGGEADGGLQPLTDVEYARFACWLRQEGLRPADLLAASVRANLGKHPDLDRNRLDALLDRGGRLAFELERWTSRGLWILGRDDPGYPSRWKSKLGEGAPPLAFGAGKRELLQQGGIGIVGSRDVDDAAALFTRAAARAAAESGMVVVSGGARGVDQIAMATALAAGGTVVGVTAEGVARPSVTADLRNHIVEGRLLLVSAVSPAVRFTIWNAMARNRLIYTLCDHVLAVSASEGNGGTWSGAIEDLRKRWVPLLVRSGQGAPPGNEALLRIGAMALTEADLCDGNGLRRALDERANEWAARQATIAQAELPFPDGPGWSTSGPSAASSV